MAMVTDPVCGERIDDGEAEAESTYNGMVYYFTSGECRDLFEADPERYVADHWEGDDVSGNEETLPL
jgi:Cu+-exporting ATPase